MAFFVPGLDDPDRAEEEYRRRAEASSCPIVPPEERIRLIEFEQTASKTVVAEVGKRRQVFQHVAPKKKSDPIPMPREAETGSVVAAIIEDANDLVYVWESERTEWQNPALVGKATTRRMERFGP